MNSTRTTRVIANIVAFVADTITKIVDHFDVLCVQTLA